MIQSDMRIAVASDVHGNRQAFAAVLADLRQISPDLILHGGDLAASGAHPAEVIDEIRSQGWRGVCGNTDEMLWAPERLTEQAALYPKLRPILGALQEMEAVTRAWVGEERIAWLKSLPRIERQEGLAVVHASPEDLWRAPFPDASDSELERVYGSLESEIVVHGHIHRPYVRRLAGFTVANSGSVSLSYDGDPRASYLLLDGPKISIRRVEYDVENAARELLDCGLPHAEWLCRILRSGQYSAPG